jgi:hypothetical protein
MSQIDGRGTRMSGIFYDPRARRVRTVKDGQPERDWALITHNVDAAPHQCRRILRESLSSEEVQVVDFSEVRASA